MIIVTSSLSKSSVFKTDTKCFQIPVVEERFGKAAFSRRISVDGKPYRRNKAAFPNSIFGWCGTVLINLLKHITNAHLLLESFLRKFSLTLTRKRDRNVIDRRPVCFTREAEESLGTAQYFYKTLFHVFFNKA